jgi:hypothetical protein
MHVLSDEQLRRTAPSIFAVAPCASVSDRYGFVPTIDVVNALRTAGWWPVHAAQTEVRKPENRNVTRHVVRFWRQEQPLQVGDTLAQLVLTNSHDRTVTYGLDVGLYRLACLNGLVVDCRELDSLRIRHGSRIVDEVIDASQEVIKRVPAVLEAVNRFQQIRLARHERERYRESDHASPFADTQACRGRQRRSLVHLQHRPGEPLSGRTAGTLGEWPAREHPWHTQCPS